MYNRGKLIEIHRDWMKTWNSDVFCFGNFWRYIGMVLIWPIPMYVFIGFVKVIIHRRAPRITDSDVS